MDLTITEAQIREILVTFGVTENDTITWLYKNVWDIGDRLIDNRKNPDIKAATPRKARLR